MRLMARSGPLLPIVSRDLLRRLWPACSEQLLPITSDDAAQAIVLANAEGFCWHVDDQDLSATASRQLGLYPLQTAASRLDRGALCREGLVVDWLGGAEKSLGWWKFTVTGESC